VTSHHELERTFDPSVGAELPDLTRLDGVDAVETGAELELEATYFDTPDLDLAAYGVTLRRRTGGSDEGWHLKLPLGDGAREEVRLPLARARHLPPKAHRDLVLALTRGASLAPVATIRTRRTEVLLRQGDKVLAEVADDRGVGQRRIALDQQPGFVAASTRTGPRPTNPWPRSAPRPRRWAPSSDASWTRPDHPLW
jgi:hypothetical protein